MDTSWSRLIDSPIGKIAKALHETDDRLTYHNWDHICRNFDHAKNTFNFEYDVALDLANLFHDSVYDNQQDKELRSIQMFHIYSDALLADMDVSIIRDTSDYIRDTICHKNVRTNEHMILLDLADLGNRSQCMINHGLIINESMNLYGASGVECAKAGLDFMSGLLKTAIHNREISDFPEYWDNIMAGIAQTMALNSGIIDRA